MVVSFELVGGNETHPPSCCDVHRTTLMQLSVQDLQVQQQKNYSWTHRVMNSTTATNCVSFLYSMAFYWDVFSVVVLWIYTHGNTICLVAPSTEVVYNNHDDMHVDTIRSRSFYPLEEVDDRHKQCIYVHLLLYSHIHSSTNLLQGYYPFSV